MMANNTAHTFGARYLSRIGTARYDQNGIFVVTCACYSSNTANFGGSRNRTAIFAAFDLIASVRISTGVSDNTAYLGLTRYGSIIGTILYGAAKIKLPHDTADPFLSLRGNGACVRAVGNGDITCRCANNTAKAAVFACS